MLLALLGLARAPSDIELVEAFKAGDREAFSELVLRYQDRIFGLCLRWMGNRQVAEEVAQDVFIALYRALPRFRGESKVSTWIFRVAVNHCKNRRLYRRRRASDRHEPLEGKDMGDDGPQRQFAHEGPGTDQTVHLSEASEILEAALEHLEEDHRTILILRDIDDLAYEEISEILDLPRGTVKSRLHRARSALAKILSRSIDQKDIFD